jgi:RNA polymerase sigma-70 factor (ECF subfamily)
VGVSANSAWSDAHAAGRQRWPEIALSRERFEEHGRGLGLGDAPSEPHLLDLYLACAGLAGDPAAVAVIDAEIVVPARTSISRVLPELAFVDDVLQELRKKLLVGPDARLGRYSGRSPLEGWVRVTATRLAYDVMRAQAARAPADLDGDLEALADQSAEPDLQVLKRRLGPSFQQALRQSLQELAPRDRTVLWMHLVQGLSLDQIARPYAVHRATAARWLADARKKVIDGVRACVREEHGPLSSEELDSLARLVASQMHLTLERLDVGSASRQR